MIENTHIEEIVAANQSSKEHEYWQQQLAGELHPCHFLSDYHNSTHT